MVRKFFAFIFTFATLFGLTFVFLAAVNASPELALADIAQESVTEAVAISPSATQMQSAFPVRVAAKSIGLDATVVNPPDTNIEILNKALLEGAVRYPTSAQLGVDGTLLLFGHSSYLPVVNNRAYKTFNNIQKLAEGEIISVYTDSYEYRYRVTSVESANATADAVSLPQDGKYLKLVTCNTFGKKEDRFIVSAVFVGVYSTAIAD